tara:strand:- start:4071 stop:4955 length:885 start_codon:yes stop_codon:yes gene_type:complete
MLAVAAPAAAQNPTPTAAISVTCAPSNINVEVKPGSTYSGFTTCTATNPTTYQEKISINVQADGLATAAPGDMYVGANDEVDFQVSVRATPYMRMDARTLSVSATVQEINGFPPANSASSNNNMIVNIMQYSLIQVEATEPFVQLMPKTDKIFEFKVYNLGNQIDFMGVGITDQSRTDLNDAGFTITLPAVKKQVDASPTGATIEVKVRTPKTQGWSDAYHILDFYAESEFQCDIDKCRPETQMITVYVRGIYLPGFEIIPALSMIALAAAVAGRRFINVDDEESEWREAAPGL